MGNDGGSIPDRRDLVRTRPKAEQADKANQTKAKWFFCALSKRKLQEPVVSCELGKLYNKDAMIEFLLDRSSYGDGENICGHIRSLKDVKTLKLTLNTSPVSATLPRDASTERTPFVCSLTLKEMNGVQPFVYISTCGCVFSQAGLKSVTVPKDKGKAKEGRSESPSSADDGIHLCPNCGTKYSKDDITALNPPPEEELELKFALQRKREKEPAKKKSKKRKHDSGGDDSEPAKKKQEKSGPVVNASAVTATSRAVAKDLAEEEAKRKANMSVAVKSLYSADENAKKQTFMTRGTFTRYA
ncbi:Rtf2 RING-finger-domain-containing protein [Crepidotus variabilis]|uniref:Rtf2 RING-finger-domain-containing protein n=1 Tax=Crepidotus variabilis TaxID=179855 RepID=A0A9P6EFF3_9AGAR|nr:Rtf2 RING-finger-domain-containing protein [Crepidotus variabilis]